ncbi:ph-response sensor protein [Parahypoxylon ruwenzoriense]
MGSDTDKAHNLPLDDPPSKPSLFSRLTSPLRSRSRNLADFHIRLQEPHRQYSAGDHVRGHVILSVVKPIRITHLTVALHGFVRVYKHAGAGAQLGPVNPAIISHERNKSVRYFGNGLASLFQDEQVLCGEGRLKPTRFEFEFDLIFPSKGLPSSIDFERGTVSYMVTATLTRPTSIAATSSCETKVALVEKVDIGLLVPPRERKVCMQTLRRRQKKKKKPTPTIAPSTHRGSMSTETQEPASDLDSTRANENSNRSSVSLGEVTTVGPPANNLPRSPLRTDLIPGDLQSEISGDSVVSNNSGSNSARGADASAESVAASKASGNDEREITATVELLKGGCLPGDILPVKINIEHNRRIKSMHGIIVTLYRQGRVDYSPPISLFTAELSKEDAERLEREDYYPRSRTGLGGLSLSSAGSCSVFRKDLSQAVAPLIIDPTTLTANITTSIRVPEDVFPSIKNVPGGLISFKYHVEVVLDLGGKLAGQTAGSSQQTSRMGSMGVPGGNPASTVGAYDLKRLANWNGAIVDTDHLRREKGVISVSFEVVVGTMDSTRTRGKSVARPALTVQPPPSEDVHIGVDGLTYNWQTEYNDPNDYNGDYDSRQIEPSPRSYYPPATSPQTSYYDFQDREAHAPVYIPPPEVPGESELSEKERVRQAEQKLLPSQPPQQPSEPEAGPSHPSAPNAASTSAANDAGHSNDNTALSTLEEDDAGEGPSAPTLADLTQEFPSTSHVDDKQELERQRLLQEASAPPEVPEDYDGEGPSAPPLSEALSSEPTAPVLSDDHEYGAPDTYHDIAGPSTGVISSEPLPRYER